MTEARQVHVSRDARFTYVAAHRRTLDGDSVELLIDLGMDTWTPQHIRVQFVDCPELNSTDPLVRERAQAAKAFTERWMVDAWALGVTESDREWPLTLVTWKDRRSFTRYVGAIENLRGESLAEALIAAGHGVRTDERGRR